MPRPRAVPSLLLQTSCMFYGAKEWLGFLKKKKKENLSCRTTTEMFVPCDPLLSKGRRPMGVGCVGSVCDPTSDLPRDLAKFSPHSGPQFPTGI